MAQWSGRGVCLKSTHAGRGHGTRHPAGHCRDVAGREGRGRGDGVEGGGKGGMEVAEGAGVAVQEEAYAL